MKFSITINATPAKVWQALWENQNYRTWAAAFAAGSHAVTDWKKGSKILFLGAEGNGMVSEVAENIPNEYMGITHLGYYKDGVEDRVSEEARLWSGVHENYRLRKVDAGTQLTVDMSGAEIPQQYLDYFINTWPKALDLLKKIAEG